MSRPDPGDQSRAAMLAAIRWALRDVHDARGANDGDVTRKYRVASEDIQEQHVERFARTVAEYRAQVTKTTARSLARAIEEAGKRRGVNRVVVPPDLPGEWLGDWAEVERDGMKRDIAARDLDQFEAVVTGCAAAVAETGTIILNGGEAQGRRAISLLPDVHICVVFEDQICGIVPEALGRLERALMEGGRPVTLISGPSATSDIELNRIEGVHGPRILEVIVVVPE